MILGFKKQFVTPIVSGIKIHTIREDKYNKWAPGRIIHFATGVRTKNYNQFKLGICYSTQQISIRYPNEYLNDVRIRVDKKLLTLDESINLAHNDGFENLVTFLLWFNDDFDGKIIHWTYYLYA